MSPQSSPIVLDYDEGIDRKALKRLTDRFLEVNRQRWLRARSALTYRQQVILDLLPLVFHLNHPGLPGYSDNDCPCGIDCYEPDEAALQAARRQARTFRYRQDRKRQPALEALFLMGSPGSLGHSVTSDLDVWLCHQPGLDAVQVRALERKASGLAEWAGSLGVELHVFVFSAEDWRAGRQSAEVAGENCGSAQHYLLLDEFYRTSVHLAGARPLWWLIPASDESRYREFADYLLQCRFIRAGDYVDFGPVPSVPPEEFLGAGVWQLYKGIETPWKSLLKLMLIECYARNREEPLLSARFKEAVFAGCTHPDELDPYLLLYRRLETWLTVSGAEERLDLVRQSLYLKAGLPLSRVSDSGNWRSAMLAALVEEWSWPDGRCRWLDDRGQWRAEDVLALRRSVVGELTHSYRLLAQLAREHGRAAAISGRDMNLLGRKLYAAFQRKAGKVEQINPGLAPSLAEENLSFVQNVEPEGPGEVDGWLMFRDMESVGRPGHQPPIRRAGHLMELVLWSYLNGLLTRGTRLNVRSVDGSVSPADLSVILDTLQQAVPVPLSPAPRETLARAVRPRVCLLFINTGVDPQSALEGLGRHRLSGYQRALGMGSGQENLVATIDQVTLNSWHEVSLQHYAAGDTLVQCLKNLLAAVAIAPGEMPTLEVLCQTPGHGSTIARRIEGLVRDLLSRFFAGGRGPHPLRYILELGGRYYVLQFRGQEPEFVALENLAALEEYLLRPVARFAPLVFETNTLSDDPCLRLVCERAEPESIQIFCREDGRMLRLWVVDEHGAVVGWQCRGGNRDNVLRPLVRFLENLTERRQLRNDMGVTKPGILLFDLVERESLWLAERRPLPDGRLPVTWMEVQAVGVRDASGGLGFDIYCDDREFTRQAWGEKLISAVADHIRACRRSKDPYPVYLTDLHLPHDLEPSVYQQDIPTARYLAYRAQLEQALNRQS